MALVSKQPPYRSARRYPDRITLRSAIRLALTTYPAGSTGAAATIAQSMAPAFGEDRQKLNPFESQAR